MRVARPSFNVRAALVTVALPLGVVLSLSFGAAPRMTVHERVEAQRAIDEVFWRHRIWPQENPLPKPPLSVVLSDEALSAKVDDYLKKSNALERVWGQKITATALQAEVDRMSRGTRDPSMLSELYEALGNDGFVIAETLARPTLADRLLRNRYAFDTRLHGALKREAERALTAEGGRVSRMRALGGEYAEVTFRQRAGGEPLTPVDGVMEQNFEEWDATRDQLARRFQSPRDALPVGRLSELHEGPDGFFAEAVLSVDERELTLATVTWRKRSFDAWWAAEGGAISSEVTIDPGSYTVAMPASGACVDDTWTRHWYAPGPRTDHTAVWTGTEMIVWGGFASVHINTGGRYNPATDSWTPTSEGSNVPAARQRHTAVWTGTEMIVWGGSDAAPSNTGGRYSPATDTWSATSTGPAVPSVRTSHTAVWTGTEMIVWGGENGTAVLKTGGRYDPLADSWTATSAGSLAPDARREHTAVWTGQSMIVWGGRTMTTSGVFGSGGSYDPTTDLWTQISSHASVAARRSHTAVWTGTEMIVWGGTGVGGVNNTGGRFDPLSQTWTTTSTPGAPSARYRHTAVWTGSQMIVWGGSTTLAFNTGGRYDPASNGWVATSMGSNVPTARWSHSAVWTGAEMIVWGGASNNATALATGGRYHPASDSWTPTSLGENVPTARFGPTAVWTGVEMIVWGGYTQVGSITYWNTGGRYTPSTDNWATTRVDATTPAGRSSHTAVWTGTEMIVWGGTSGVKRKDGGRYDPAADSWTPTSTTGAVPTARALHTAVWTGTEMIVWGGGGGTNTGGRYDPSTDHWVPTSRGAGTPTEREGHTAVWTGSEMIVWGGEPYGPPSGGRYDPSSDTWMATSLVGTVPEDRFSHTAVWTGTEMIVWGGQSTISGDVLNNGGRYRPSTDHWTPTSSTGAPGARRLHTAVWTGTEMIVWGGAGGPSLNTGGRYDPVSDTWAATWVAGSAPLARSSHAAAWTGTEMAVWGGSPLTDLHLYCACGGPVIAYGDRDGDGFGDSHDTVTGECNTAPPPGYAPTDDDCNDAYAAIHPGAPETCEGIDNDCDGVIDNHAACWPICSFPSGGEVRLTTTPGPSVGPTLISAEGGYALSWFEMVSETRPQSSHASFFPLEDWTHNYFVDRILFTLLDFLGARRSPDTTISDYTIGTKSKADIAWTGSGYGITWLSFDDGDATPGSDNSAYFARMDETGTKIGGNVHVPTDSEAEWNPSILWSGTEYVVSVPQDDWVSLTRLTPEGAALTSSSFYSVGHPSNALTADTGYGVFRVLDPGVSLTKLDPLGEEVSTTFSFAGGTGDGLAAVRAGEQYGLAWFDITGDQMMALMFARTDADGTLLGAPVTVTDTGPLCWAGCSYLRPSLVWTGVEYGLAWQDKRDGTYQVYLARFDDQGQQIGPQVRATSGPHPAYEPSLAWNGTYALAWLQTSDNAASEIYFNTAECDCGGDGDGDGAAYCMDCDDSSGAIHAAAPELCNAVDDNCNGLVDDGPDSDEDLFVDPCDNCPTVPNALQQNSDGDGSGDACDVDDGVIYLRFPAGDQLAWDEETTFSMWNVYRGDLAVLRATGEYTQAPDSNLLASRVCGLASPSFDDSAAVPTGSCAFYLVTGVASSVEGGLGTDSAGVERSNTHSCP